MLSKIISYQAITGNNNLMETFTIDKAIISYQAITGNNNEPLGHHVATGIISYQAITGNNNKCFLTMSHRVLYHTKR